jgi:glycosyltransferase involved in cell wall biosynthesis
MKKKMAVWMYGGIGTGHFSQGYPMLEKLLVGLSCSFEVVVYSKFPTNKDYHTSNFKIRSAPTNIKWTSIRWLCLITYFLKDHRHHKFHLLFAFWGYPSGFLATCLSKVFKIPCAVYLLGSDIAGIASINFGILHRPILRRLALWAYNRASLLLTISDYQKSQLKRYEVLKGITIPWGTEITEYKFIAKKPGSTLHIIHVGHLAPVKDQITLIKTFALIERQYPAELRIFGEDFLNGAIQKLCKELNIEGRVQFFGVVPYHQMPEEYAWADLMLHTSLSEGQSMALTEAAATGVLLAGTNVGLLYDLGEDCGLTVEAGDFGGLAEKVLNTLNDPQSWDLKTQRAREWAVSHDLSWTIHELELRLKSLTSDDRR